MRRTFLTVAVLALAACGSTSAPPAPAPDPVVHVALRVPPDPSARLAVELRADFGAEETALRPAAAAVGAYRPARFGDFFHALAAYDAEGRPLRIREREDGAHVVEGPLARVTYEVDARAGEAALEDLAVSDHRRAGYAFVSGYATFLVVEGAEERPHELRLELPPGWRAASALERIDAETFRAGDALELLDEPVMAGDAFASLEIDDVATPGAVHLFGGEADPSAQLATIADAYRAGVRSAEAVGLPPMRRPYHVFVELFEADPDRRLGWAMEHDHSTVLDYAEGQLTEASARFTYHVVHEILHAWIPRRLYTASLRPRAQMAATPTPHVWLAEGFEQYLAFVGVARAGVLERDVVLRMIVRRFATPYAENAPPEPVALAEHSLRICGGDHGHWAFHYGAGGLLALLIDQRMRAVGDGRRGLPEALAELVESAPEEGIPDAELEARLSAATGLDLGPLFDRHVRGAEPLDVADILRGAGLARVDGEPVLDEAADESARRFVELAFAAP